MLFALRSHDEHVIGKAETFAKPGTMFDILISL